MNQNFNPGLALIGSVTMAYWPKSGQEVLSLAYRKEKMSAIWTIPFEIRDRT